MQECGAPHGEDEEVKEMAVAATLQVSVGTDILIVSLLNSIVHVKCRSFAFCLHSIITAAVTDRSILFSRLF